MSSPILNRDWDYSPAERHCEGYLREKWDRLYPGWRDKPQREPQPNVTKLKAKGKQ